MQCFQERYPLPLFFKEENHKVVIGSTSWERRGCCLLVHLLLFFWLPIFMSWHTECPSWKIIANIKNSSSSILFLAEWKTHRPIYFSSDCLYSFLLIPWPPQNWPIGVQTWFLIGLPKGKIIWISPPNWPTTFDPTNLRKFRTTSQVARDMVFLILLPRRDGKFFSVGVYT